MPVCPAVLQKRFFIIFSGPFPLFFCSEGLMLVPVRLAMLRCKNPICFFVAVPYMLALGW